MSFRAEEFGPDQAALIARQVDRLSRTADMEVALIGFRDQDGHLCLTFSPGCEIAIVDYLAGINWSHARDYIREHYVD